jgi:hypothetical protein
LDDSGRRAFRRLAVFRRLFADRRRGLRGGADVLAPGREGLVRRERDASRCSRRFGSTRASSSTSQRMPAR